MKFTPGTTLPGGFRVVSVNPVKSMNAEVRRFEHVKSGARIVHVSSADTENCFCICLPTPPPDDTGMPHILEHMTLAGSEKYPCKEPFFEMIKRSMATFINALTGNDMTYYPVSSNVHKDLFNLADVYFDAVFHPLLTRDIFRREAHHLAPADPEKPLGDLRIDGIVYSEMKGVFSDPESILERDACRSLLPDTCHGFESGGDPEAIPDLTLEQLRAFHATNYHPSNAYIILYGDIPSEDYLAFLAPRLEPYDRIEPLPPPKRQPHWPEPRVMRDFYPVPAGESLNEKTYLMLNWLTGDSADPAQAALMSILSLLLVGNDGAPLTKAVNDSHIGANVLFEGVNASGLEATFHIAVDGSEPDRLDAFRKLVLDTLADIASRPFPEDQIKAAFQQSVYACVEITNSYPLNTAFRVAATWSAGLEPANYLDFLPFYEELRQKLEKDPLLLNRTIREKLIDNTHRLDIVLAPDTECEARTEAKLAERLKAARSGLTDDDLRAIAADAEHLSAINAAPNPPELVAALPKLDVADIPKKPREIPFVAEELGNGRALLLVNDIPSNDVVYFSAAFDLTGLPEELWPYLRRYTGAISDFGTKGRDYAATARRRAAVCGGLSATIASTTTAEGPDHFVPYILLSLKTTMSSLDEALDAFEEALFELDPEDHARMDEILVQDRTVLRADFVQDARTTANVHAARDLGLIHHRKHIVDGLPQLALIEELAGDTAAAYPRVTSTIAQIRNFILNRRRADFTVTAPARANATLRARISRWLDRMADAPVTDAPCPFTPSVAPRVEGLSAALQVAFSSYSIPAPHFTDPDAKLLQVGATLVSSNYILPELRFKGNAYGAGLVYAGGGSRLNFSSYRDPHVAETIAVYRNALDYVRNVKWTQEEIDNAVITAAKGEETPFRPASTAAAALSYRIGKYTEDFRQRHWATLLSATPEKVRDVLVRVLEEGLPHASGCIAASAEMLEAARPALPELTITPIK